MSAQLLAEELSKAFHGEWADKKIPEFARLEPIVQRVVAALRAQGEPVAWITQDSGLVWREGHVPARLKLYASTWCSPSGAQDEPPRVLERLYSAPPTERAK